MARDPIFLEQKSYRQRRLMDAVRLLPFLGLALWMVPILWATPGETETATSIVVALRYIFGVWIFVVLVSWALWRRTRDLGAKDEDAR